MGKAKVNSKRLYLKIKAAYQNRDYQSVIVKYQEYIQIPNIYVPCILPYYCAVAYQELNDLENAVTLYKQSIKLGADSELKASIARRLHNTKYAILSYELLLEVVQDPTYKKDLAYFILGKTELYQGNNEIALQYFYQAYEYATNETARFKITTYIKNTHLKIATGMRTIDFDFYRLKGENLLPGQIVYVKKDNTANIKTSNYDPKKDDRPYLVVYIQGQSVIALPLTTQELILSYYNLIPKEISGFPKNRYIKDEIAIFNLDDISNIIGAMSLDFYQNLLRHIYSRCYHQSPQIINQIEQAYLEAYGSKMQPQVHDIITIFNFSDQTNYNYFITSIDEENYYATKVEVVDKQFWIVDEHTILPKTTKPLFLTSPSCQVKERLLSELGETRK